MRSEEIGQHEAKISSWRSIRHNNGLILQRMNAGIGNMNVFELYTIHIVYY